MEVVSCGVPFLFAPLRSLQEVRSVQFRLDVWDQVLRGFERRKCLSSRKKPKLARLAFIIGRLLLLWVFAKILRPAERAALWVAIS
jgi:hypothetical protein